jgi:hypothetical protein
MSNIPSSALERFRKLRDRAAADRAAYREAVEEAAHERGEVGRLHGIVQTHGTGAPLQVDDDGTVYSIERVRGPADQIVAGSAVGPVVDLSERRKIAQTTPELRATVAQLLAARGRLADAMARQAELSRAGEGVLGLANRCEALLRERGWTPSGGAEVRGAASYEVSR